MKKYIITKTGFQKDSNHAIKNNSQGSRGYESKAQINQVMIKKEHNTKNEKEEQWVLIKTIAK